MIINDVRQNATFLRTSDQKHHKLYAAIAQSENVVLINIFDERQKCDCFCFSMVSFLLNFLCISKVKKTFKREPNSNQTFMKVSTIFGFVID